MEAFINFWNKLTSGSSQEVASVGKPAEAKKEEVKPVKQHVIGIVVGHNSKAQGAVNYKGETEFAFNSRVATKMKAIIDADPSFDGKIYNRTPGASYGNEIAELAADIKKDACEISIELHFNSGPKGAMGCEILAHAKNKLAIKIADKITDKLAATFGLKQRDQDGVKELNKGDRGAYNLIALEDVGVRAPILVEPCFANEKTAESQKIFDNEDLYAKTLAEEMILHAKGVYGIPA
jgi:N-acetylmuramoyl-L-alanine amidase